jgi:3-isopropylmalate/(R)-2-methylmalate dehydratase large subunit
LKIIGDLKSDGATYCALEFTGPVVKNMTVSERAVLCNMAVEAGAKNGIVEADEKTVEFLKDNNRNFCGEFIQSDQDAVYFKELNYNLAEIKPAVTFPHFVDNYHSVEDVSAKKINIDQGFIGSCNNGRIENLREAAKVLKNRKIKNGTKLLISPASQSVYKEALSERLVEIFINSGATFLNPGCSSCWGGCQGILAAGENGISTGTRLRGVCHKTG